MLGISIVSWGENVMKGGGGMGKVPTTRIWTVCHVP